LRGVIKGAPLRILAIDYGKTRVGIAITDPLGVISQPLVTLKYRNDKSLVERLKYLVKQNNVGTVLVGNPLSMQGKPTAMSQTIERFVTKLRRVLKVEVKLWDERMTSKYAQMLQKEMGIKNYREKTDQIAACIILDEYLKTQSHCSA